MSRLGRTVVLIVFLCSSVEVFAFGGRARSTGVTTYYYYPVPVSVMPAYPIYAIPAQPTPFVPSPPLIQTTPEPPLATPTPAPPSATPVTPSLAPQPTPSPGPTIREQHSFLDTGSAVPRVVAKLSPERCAAGFWNLSDRDLVLRIDGQAHLLPRGKNLLLSLNRQFTWQVEGRDAQFERVPPEEGTVEIVIRR